MPVSGTKRVGVIGAGMVGVCAASWLQRDGHSVFLVEAGEPGHGASFGNAGCFNGSSVTPVSMPGVIRNVPRWLVGPTRSIVAALELPAGDRSLARSFHARRDAGEGARPGPRIASAGRPDPRSLAAAGQRRRRRGSRAPPRPSLCLSLRGKPGKGSPRLGIAAGKWGRDRRIRR